MNIMHDNNFDLIILRRFKYGFRIAITSILGIFIKTSENSNISNFHNKHIVSQLHNNHKYHA